MNAFPSSKLLLVFVLSVLPACDKKQEQQSGSIMDLEQPVEVMPVQRMHLRETTQLVGSIEANESAELRPEYPGVVADVLFEEGAKLSKGDPLIKLDTRELETQLAETRASLALASKTLQRNRKLLEDRAISELEVDAAEAEHARLGAIAGRLEVQLEKSTLRAPFDGLAGARSISVGDYVTSNQVVTTVDDLSRLKVEMEVPERYLPLLHKGGIFQLRAATTPDGETVQGEVYFVSPRIDVETRSTQVKGVIATPPQNLKPGMFANITLVLREVEGALVAPESAVGNGPKGNFLVRPAGPEGRQVVAFVPVKLGIRVPGWVQVTPVKGPLEEGDKIVSAGVGSLILIPGRKLKLVEPLVTPTKPPADVTDRRLE